MGIREGLISSAGSTIVVRTKDVNSFTRKMIFFNQETRSIARKTLNKAAIVIRKSIREEAPVKSGKARRSVKVLTSLSRKDEFIKIIGPDGSAVNAAGKHYVPLIVSGTFRVRANNFILRGYMKAIPEVRKLFTNMKRDLSVIVRKTRAKR